MSFADLTDEVYDAIRAHLGDGISVGAWQYAPIAYPNEAFSAPEPPAPWVDFEITGTLYGQQSIGAHVQSENRWDEDGQIWLHVMVPVGTGGAAARGAAKTLANIFRGLTLLSGGLEFLDAQIGLGEPGDDNGNYFRISVSIDWRRMDA